MPKSIAIRSHHERNFAGATHARSIRHAAWILHAGCRGVRSDVSRRGDDAGFSYDLSAVSAYWSITCIEMALWKRSQEIDPSVHNTIVITKSHLEVIKKRLMNSARPGRDQRGVSHEARIPSPSYERLQRILLTTIIESFFFLVAYPEAF